MGYVSVRIVLPTAMCHLCKLRFFASTNRFFKNWVWIGWWTFWVFLPSCAHSACPLCIPSPSRTSHSLGFSEWRLASLHFFSCWKPVVGRATCGLASPVSGAPLSSSELGSRDNQRTQRILVADILCIFLGQRLANSRQFEDNLSCRIPARWWSWTSDWLNSIKDVKNRKNPTTKSNKLF